MRLGLQLSVKVAGRILGSISTFFKAFLTSDNEVFCTADDEEFKVR